MIDVQNISKHYGKKQAVTDLSFTVEPGKVTGFIGPNGAGKSTTMRLMLGLDKGGGKTLYDGKDLFEYDRPSSMVGILLEAKAFHPRRTARNHLRVIAAAAEVTDKRVDEVIDIVGLTTVSNSKPGKFSLGMGQRLGIAAAILAEPKYLLLDEPANGLDPEGIAWLRNFLKTYAKKGNGILVSSHLLSELEQVADNIVVIGKGKLISQASVKDLESGNKKVIFVKSSKSDELSKALIKAKYGVKKHKDGLLVSGASEQIIGDLALKNKIAIYELSVKGGTLEDAFLELTSNAEEFQAHNEPPKPKKQGEKS